MEIKIGIYQHYKGHKYRVLGVAKHSESLDELVVYQNVDNGELWVRPIEMFLEEVEVDGQKVLRFKYVS
jgi:hypothetical protein